MKSGVERGVGLKVGMEVGTRVAAGEEEVTTTLPMTNMTQEWEEHMETNLYEEMERMIEEME